MPTAKAKTQRAAKHRVIGRRTVPMDAIFESWELVNWSAINRDVAAGKTVQVESADARDEKHWIGCAVRELGRQNVFVVFCHVRLDSGPSLGLWIIPRKMLTDVLLDEFERVCD